MTTHTFSWHARTSALHASSGFAIWRAILAALLIVALLVAFHSVVRGALHAGEMRRQAFAAQANAMRECRAMSGSASARCLKDLAAQGTAADAAQLAPPILSASVQDY